MSTEYSLSPAFVDLKERQELVEQDKVLVPPFKLFGQPEGQSHPTAAYSIVPTRPVRITEVVAALAIALKWLA